MRNYDILYDMKNFRVSNYKIRLDKSRYSLNQPVRLVMLSDLHNCVYGNNNESLVQAVKEMQPDGIIIAGDMVTASVHEKESVAVSLMQRLAKISTVFYGNGNHEYRMKTNTDSFGTRYFQYADTLRKAGIHVLENESIHWQVHGLKINIYAFELPDSYYRRVVKKRLSVEEVQKSLGPVEGDAFQVLIAHNPVWFPVYAAWGADLTFSGHLHGGSLRLPLLGGIISPQLALFPKYDKGMFTQGRHQMIVGAGIGSHNLLPRINNPPELVAVEMK